MLAENSEVMPATRTNAPILCVDDHENILAGWKMLLEREGC